MSARGAEGILKAAGKLPADPPPITSSAPAKKSQGKGSAPVRGTARATVTDQDAKAKVKAADAAATEQEDGGQKKAKEIGEKAGTFVGQKIGKGISLSNEAGGFVLALLLWGWIVRPYLAKGVPGVKATLMAKFFNKKLDGTELP